MMVTCHQTAQVCHLDTTEVMLFADQHRRSLGGAAAYGLIVDMPGVATVQPQAILVQPPTISYIEPRGPSERLVQQSMSSLSCRVRCPGLIFVIFVSFGRRAKSVSFVVYIVRIHVSRGLLPCRIDYQFYFLVLLK